MMTATERAWLFPFKGNAASVLLETISICLDKRREPYLRHSSVVNSSGTGKSRMVDEVAMKIITVPICLREHGSQGFTFPSLLFCVLNLCLVY
jgi:hypothetical protein